MNGPRRRGWGNLMVAPYPRRVFAHHGLLLEASRARDHLEAVALEERGSEGLHLVRRSDDVRRVRLEDLGHALDPRGEQDAAHAGRLAGLGVVNVHDTELHAVSRLRDVLRSDGLDENFLLVGDHCGHLHSFQGTAVSQIDWHITKSTNLL